MNNQINNNKWKKTLNLIKTGMSFIVIIGLFLVSFLANSCAEVNLSGYFIYNETSQKYDLLTPKKTTNFDDIKDDKHVYIIGDSYYVLINEQAELLEHKEFEKLPKEVYKNTIIQVKTSFLSVSNFEKQVKSITFWVSTISTTAMIVAAFLMVYGVTQTKQFNSDEFKRTQNDYNLRVKIKPVNFNMFIESNNYEEKKRVYLEKHNKLIAKYKQKLTLIPQEKMVGNGIAAKRYKRLSKLLILKINMQLRLIDSEYMNKYLKSMKVKYRQLHAENYIYDNIANKEIDTRKDFSKEKERKYAKTTQKVFTSMIFAVALTAFVTNLFLNIAIGPQMIITICSVIVSVSLSIYSSIIFEQTVFADEIMQPLQNKIVILDDSIKWSNGMPDESVEDLIKRVTSELKEDDSKQEAAIQQPHEKKDNLVPHVELTPQEQAEILRKAKLDKERKALVDEALKI